MSSNVNIWRLYGPDKKKRTIMAARNELGRRATMICIVFVRERNAVIH